MQTIRITPPGYNALTDTNQDHYSIFADTDNILIKEFTRGSVSIASGNSSIIAHNLNYLPLTLVTFNDGSYAFWVYGDGIYGSWSSYVTTTNLVLTNKGAGTKTFKY